jgi:ABC-type uncharacterized transport system auxiliary subunit
MKRLAMWTMVLACVAAGCVKARTLRYYTLSIPPAATQTEAQPIPVTIVVGRLSAPHLLRDNRVVYAMSDVELGVDEYHRWSEPPTGLIERLLVEKLRASRQYRAVQHLSSTTRGDYILRGYLGALNEVDDPTGIKARFTLQLELFDVKAGNVVWNDRYTSDEPVPQKTVTAVVQILQKSVNTGLDQLTASLGQYFAAHAAH